MIDVTSNVQNWANGVFVDAGLGILSTSYGLPGHDVDSLDAYDFYQPSLMVTYH